MTESEGEDDSSHISRARPSRPRRPVLLDLSLLLTLALAACARSTPDAGAPSLLPGGYLAHVDSGRSDPGHFVLNQDKDGIHILTGPGGIAWRPADSIRGGDFKVEATLTVMGAPVGYREGYGIFVGGRDLESASQRYVYLLVRSDGRFTVGRRRGPTNDVVMDWTPHALVQGVVADGDTPVNTLAIAGSDDEIRFLVNGAVVYRAPPADIRPYGLAGIRISHRLDARLLSWSLGSTPTNAPADSSR